MSAEIVPLAEPFDRGEVRRLLLELDGNVTKAAKRLKVEPDRLRAYVQAVPALRRALDEADDRIVDEALDVIHTALRDENSIQNRFYAAKVILGGEAARTRGFGPRQNAASIEVRPPGGGVITLRWLEPPKEEA